MIPADELKVFRWMSVATSIEYISLFPSRPPTIWHAQILVYCDDNVGDYCLCFDISEMSFMEYSALLSWQVEPFPTKSGECEAIDFLPIITCLLMSGKPKPIYSTPSATFQLQH
jgi:hypothetical protein